MSVTIYRRCSLWSLFAATAKKRSEQRHTTTIGTLTKKFARGHGTNVIRVAGRGFIAQRVKRVGKLSHEDDHGPAIGSLLGGLFILCDLV